MERIIKVANDIEIKLNEMIELLVEFGYAPGVEYKINAIIFLGMSHRLILGMEFIKLNNVVIDVQEELIRIDN
ncbi:hypothetical protein A0H76_1523 [Hepatospora eriocheir]|uniref:Uncharacterized protein n=1 Tax=Hepatospora eriocheir TaxID=1081669 RepID=A0A1X0QKN8_9MICR|nr:hypothetical protein A0H76_1523 [Hepatospora eriocheir]